MHVPSLRSSGEHPAALSSHSDDGFLTRSLIPVLRNLFFSSLLWVCLAFALYGVYTLIASS
ncbi:MAG TPA: hypothetical protein VFE38_12560 [Edaphobacter sp.]|nr:hypothetical protein [Edaphobacter sp.]